jgi:hypothetical protein
MGGVWSMLEVSNWKDARCPDRSNRPPVASKNNASTASTAAVPKNTATNNAIIKNNAAKNNAPKNNAAKNTNTTTKNAKNTNTMKAATVLHAAATKSAANNTAGV